MRRSSSLALVVLLAGSPVIAGRLLDHVSGTARVYTGEYLSEDSQYTETVKSASVTAPDSGSFQFKTNIGTQDKLSWDFTNDAASAKFLVIGSAINGELYDPAGGSVSLSFVNDRAVDYHLFVHSDMEFRG